MTVWIVQYIFDVRLAFWQCFCQFAGDFGRNDLVRCQRTVAVNVAEDAVSLYHDEQRFGRRLLTLPKSA